jgi:hypothetical protein
LKTRSWLEDETSEQQSTRLRDRERVSVCYLPILLDLGRKRHSSVKVERVEEGDRDVRVDEVGLPVIKKSRGETNKDLFSRC